MEGVKWILENNIVHINQTDSLYVQTALHWVLCSKLSKDNPTVVIEICKLLIAHGIHTSIKDRTNKTAAQRLLTMMKLQNVLEQDSQHVVINSATANFLGSHPQTINFT